MTRVAVVDYGMCNLDSVARAIEECGGVPVVTDSPQKLGMVDRIILPGVGAFPDGMQNLCARGLDDALREVADGGAPLLGICLGMQLLASEGWEGSRRPGLGLIDGTVQRIASNGHAVRIPHIGWNEVDLLRPSPLFNSVASGRDFYFVHSYALVCDRPSDVLASTSYGAGFVAAVQRDNVFGVQFHPEKSQKLGLQLLRNFLAL